MWKNQNKTSLTLYRQSGNKTKFNYIPQIRKHYKFDYIPPIRKQNKFIRVKELSGKLEPGCRESIIYASIEYVKDATKFIFNPSQKKGCKTKATQFS